MKDHENFNTTNPLVSVLMTAYNREKYIVEAIESVLASTYTNFELIIVDDCSKDSTVKIAKEYEQKDKRIRVYINEENQGDYPNRNKAASYAKGKYLKYVDADDLIYPHGLEVIVGYMENNPEADWGLCSLDQDNEKIFPICLSPKEIFEYHYYKAPLFHKAPLSAIMKKSVFDSVNGFSGKQHLGDCELWHVLSIKSPVLLMPHGIVWARNHPDQQMQANRSDARVPFKYWVGAWYFFKTNNELPIDSKKRQEIIRKYNKMMNRLIFVKLGKFKLNLVLDLVRLKRDKSLTFGNKITLPDI